MRAIRDNRAMTRSGEVRQAESGLGGLCVNGERADQDPPRLTRARSSPTDGVPRLIGGSGSTDESAVPVPYDAQVERTQLVSWFRQLEDAPVVLITASAGYGKTTLLQQWADSQ